MSIAILFALVCYLLIVGLTLQGLLWLATSLTRRLDRRQTRAVSRGKLGVTAAPSSPGVR
jgi:hypothetical protein